MEGAVVCNLLAGMFRKEQGKRVDFPSAFLLCLFNLIIILVKVSGEYNELSNRNGLLLFKSTIMHSSVAAAHRGLSSAMQETD